MRIHTLILATAIPLSPIALRQASPSEVGREACRVAVDGRVSGPSVDICAQLLRRWTALLPVSLPPGVITLEAREGFTGSAGSTQWTLVWPLPGKRSLVNGASARPDGITPSFATAVMPHEAGHWAFSIILRRAHIADAHDGYMSVAPDWFDEAPAIWMESRADREKRMLPIVGSTPSLADLVTMRNPSADPQRSLFATEFSISQQTTMPPCPPCTFLPDSVRNKYRVTAIGVHAGGRPDTLVRYLDHDPAGETLEQKNFYPLSYSLLRFIRTRGGVKAIEELIARYRVNPTRGAEVLANLPGLPKTVAAFEKAWHAWLSAPPAETE